MICEHCGKPIKMRISDSIKKTIFKLKKDGYSVRDTSVFLQENGLQASFASVARILRGKQPTSKEENSEGD